MKPTLIKVEKYTLIRYTLIRKSIFWPDVLNSDIVEEDNDDFCLADLAQLFSKCIPPEGKTSKHKENKVSVRNAEGRLMACIHFLIYVHL